MKAGLASRIHGQRGAATLVVVMMLFLIMALLAAYANRSLLFEQRISSSYYRASMAQEMAEGGLDWTVAMLNGTATNESCEAVATNGKRFVDRYLNISATDREIQRKSTIRNLTKANVDCVRSDTGLVCHCPEPDAYSPQAAIATGGPVQPSVAVSMFFESTRQFAGFGIQSHGCSDSSVANCARAVDMSQAAISSAVQNATVALVSAVPASPGGALTVKGTLTTAGAGGLGLHNTDSKSAGTLVVSGGAAPTLDDQRMDSVPGTPASAARVFNDQQLTTMSSDRVFQVFMGVTPSRYKNHPALRKINSGTCAANCAQELKEAYDAGKRMVWIEGNMTMASNVIIGTVTDPMLIIVDGDATLSGPFQLTGMLVAKNLTWTNTSGLTSMINGSVLVTGDMSATGQMDIQYLQPVADQLRNRLGSFVRVSGSWIDTTVNQ